MPHLVILYTPDLEAETDMTALCRSLAQTMAAVKDEAENTVFPTGGIRVLAYPAAHAAVADGRPGCGFVYLNLRMGRGRSASVQQAAGQALAESARAHFAPLLARRPVGVTLQIDEGGEVFDAKLGNLHPLFAKSRHLIIMLTDATIEALARELYEARKRRAPVRHFSRRHPEMNIADGYAIQQAWVRLELADGRSIRGRKIGLTSRAMQQASQIDEPDYAPLMDDMFFASGSDLPIDRFIAPRIEVELAFILGKPLRGPGITLFDVLGATDFVSPAIEIIDARIEQFDRETGAMRKVYDTISDFAANAGIVLGGRPVRPMDVDLRWVGALLHKNGVIEETGLAAGVLNHPGNGVAWLANKIAVHDEQLNAGDVVLAGSFTRPTGAVRGDSIHADYGPLGSIAFRFV